MAKTPENHGKAWTRSDDTQLRKLARENTPTRGMGFKLGRNDASIYGHASQEGLSLKPTNQSLYNRLKK